MLLISYKNDIICWDLSIEAVTTNLRTRVAPEQTIAKAGQSAQATGVKNTAEAASAYLKVPDSHSAVLHERIFDSSSKSQHFLFQIGRPSGYFKSNIPDLKSKSYQVDPRLIKSTFVLTGIENEHYSLPETNLLSDKYDNSFIALDIYEDKALIYLLGNQNSNQKLVKSDFDVSLLPYAEFAFELSRAEIEKLFAKSTDTESLIGSNSREKRVLRNRELAQLLFDFLLEQGSFYEPVSAEKHE